MRKVEENEVLQEALRDAARRSSTARPRTLLPAADVRLMDVLIINKAERSLSQPPRIGDVVALKATPQVPDTHTIGVVLGVQQRRDGVWTRVDVLVQDGVQQVTKSAVERIIGRPKGVSRIDQATRQLEHRTHGGTHGWFVRIYEGKKHKLARMFSDNRYGSSAEALKAALAFHAQALKEEGRVVL